MKSLGLAFVVLAACVPARKPVQKPVAQTVRPFEAPPSVTLVDTVQPGPLYRVELDADITRDVMPTDDLAIVVSVDDQEVGRYPVVGKFAARPTRIKQEIELPLGDYEIDYEYKGERYAGLPFRLADVPVWGGKRGLQVRMHPGTRVSLREKKLWVGRWWANDGMPQAWIVEWVREGGVVTMTSGREDRGIPTQTDLLVQGAAGAFRDARVVQNTVWTYGEEYPIPDVVAQQPGTWAARVVHGNSPPVAVVFSVLPGGILAEVTSRRVQGANWEPSWSKRLEQRALSISEVERLTAKLPRTSSTMPLDEVNPQFDGPEPPIRLTTSAVRAVFRSKQLADTWASFVALDTAQTAYVEQTPPKGARSGIGSTREAPGKEGEKKAKLHALRIQIEAWIKVYGTPWKPEEFPRS